MRSETNQIVHLPPPPFDSQVEVSLHFQACSSLFTGCTGGARPQILKKEYAHAVEEVVCLGRMQSAWSGDSSPGCGAKVTGQTVRASSGRGYDTADDQTDSGSITLRRFIEISGRLLLAASTGVEESYHAPSAAAHTERKKDKSATVAPCSIAEFESHAETILFLSPSPSAAQSQKHQPVPYALSPALKAWVALLAAKTSLCAYREHQRAYKWVRRALSYVVLRSSDSPKLGGMGGEGASCVAIDRCLPRLEVGQYLFASIELLISSTSP